MSTASPGDVPCSLPPEPRPSPESQRSTISCVANPAAHGHALFNAGIMRLIDRETPRRIAAVVMAQQQLIRLVGQAALFTGSDREREERRCGRFAYLDQPLAFAIEYRDAKALRPSRNPADPKATRRILTIMLASEAALPD